MNIDSSKIHIYPAVREDYPEDALNTEHNTAAFMQSVVDSANVVLSGLQLTLNNTILYINSGECLIDGYLMKITTQDSINLDQVINLNPILASDKYNYFVSMQLVVDSANDLLGDADNIYQGLKVTITDTIPTTALILGVLIYDNGWHIFNIDNSSIYSASSMRFSAPTSWGLGQYSAAGDNLQNWFNSTFIIDDGGVSA